jgi:hypothetical protein
MTDSANDLPDDIERLKAMLIAERTAHAAERSRLVEQNDRLLHTLRQRSAITSGASRSA